jgi:methyltransferase (TIGR00027 family)
MEAGKPSATAIGAAIKRALHQRLDESPRVFDDPVAERLVGQELTRYGAITRWFPFARRVRANMVMRSRYAEDWLAESIVHGVRQYVVLGAGLDTFAYRQPGWAASIRIFEVDDRATQGWKRNRLVAAGISVPTNLTFVPVDFERSSLDKALTTLGFELVPTFFSWLGVTQYLSEDAIELLLKFVFPLPAGSEIVFSFVLASNELSISERCAVALLAATSRMRGEPWVTRYSPRQLEDHLVAMGFSKVIHFSTEEANERYFRGRHDGLAVSSAEQIMRAIV